MDRVRLGRALGYGARHAGKSLAQVVDAVSAPSSHAAGTRLAEREVSKRAKVAGKSAWAPVARFSSVLWLEVTGAFFALIAAYLSQGLWRTRGALRSGTGTHEADKFLLHAVAFAVFAYFAASNFVRAWRRERR